MAWIFGFGLLCLASFWPAAESHGENLRKGRKLWNWAAESHIWGRCERWDAAVTGCTLHNESRCSDHLSSGPENPDLEITLGNLTPSRNGSDVHLQWWAPRKSEVPWNPQDNDLTGCAVYWDMLKAYPRYNASDFNGGNVRVSENGEATLRVHSPATYLVGRMWVATPHIHLRLCSNESFAHTKQDAVIFTGEGVYAVGTQTYSDLTIVNFTNLTWAAEVGKGPPNDTVNIAGMLVSSRRRSTTVVPTTTSSLADKSTDESEETTFTTSTQGLTTTTAAATTSASSGTNVTETSTGAPSTVAPSTSATSASTNVSTSQPASGQTVIVVTGILDPIVPDCNQFVSTFGTQDSLASGIAEVGGVKQSDVAVSMKCADSARLLATGDAPFRQLGGESVHVNYQITVSVEEGFADGSTSGTSGATAESVTAAIKKETPASLTSRIGAALQDNGITTITLTVETIAEPQVERMIRTTSLAPAQTTSTSASSTSSEATTSMWIDASTTLMPISSSATPDWRLNSSFKDFKKPMTAMNLDALEFSPIYQCFLDNQFFDYFSSDCVTECPETASEAYGQCVRPVMQPKNTTLRAVWSLKVQCTDKCLQNGKDQRLHYTRLALADMLDIPFQEVVKVGFVFTGIAVSSRRLASDPTAEFQVLIVTQRIDQAEAVTLLTSFLADAREASDIFGFPVDEVAPPELSLDSAWKEPSPVSSTATNGTESISVSEVLSNSTDPYQRAYDREAPRGSVNNFAGLPVGALPAEAIIGLSGAVVLFGICFGVGAWWRRKRNRLLRDSGVDSLGSLSALGTVIGYQAGGGGKHVDNYDYDVKGRDLDFYPAKPSAAKH